MKEKEKQLEQGKKKGMWMKIEENGNVKEGKENFS